MSNATMPEPASPASTEAMRGHAAMLVFSALIAGSYTLGGQIANEIAPAALNAVRFVIAALVIGAIVVARGGVTSQSVRAPWRYILIGGLFAVYFVTMFEGLKTAAPVSAAAVFTLTPIMSAGFGWVLLRQGVTPRIVLAITLGGIGAIWVIFRADFTSLRAFEIGPGEAIFFWGCMAHAAYPPLVRRLNRGEPILVFTFLTLTACAALLLIWGAGDLARTSWADLRPLVWVTILYTAIVASAASVFLVQYASMRLPAAKVMAYTYLTPSWVIGWELALGQPLPPLLILLGLGASIVALLLLLKD